MKPKLVGIYQIRNSINGKVYIGQSINILGRWKDHRCRYKGYQDYPLYRAMVKYGINNFEFTILTTCQEHELDDLEIKYIEMLGSYSDGYNATVGGCSAPSYKLDLDSRYNIIEDIKNNDMSTKEIALKYNIKGRTISLINSGIINYVNDIEYPINPRRTMKHISDHRSTFICKSCGYEHYGRLDKVYCKDCWEVKKHVRCYMGDPIVKPSRVELNSEMFIKASFSAVGRNHNVSPTMIKRWLASYELPTNIAHYKL